MSDFQSYFLMSEQDVISYVQKKLDFFAAGSHLSCKEIGDGNLNYVFRVKDDITGRSIIVKQASKTLRISKEMELNIDRGRIESEILSLQEKLCPGMVPHVYLYDTIMCAMIMEDMTGHEMMRDALIAHKTFPAFADQISTYLVQTLLLTTDFVLDPKDKKILVKNFTNPNLCEITEELVFTEPYNDLHHRNNVYPPMLPYIQKHFYEDNALHIEIAKLKEEFMNHAQALIHGDLHTGSIFINREHTFVFDPEFAFYGPMGYDIGNIIANLMFALINGFTTISSEKEKDKFINWNISCIKNIIDLFKNKFLKAFDQHVADFMAQAEGYKDCYLHSILENTAATVGLECIRRVIGMAKVKDITCIKAESDRIFAETFILKLAKNCIMHRADFVSGEDYINEISSVLEVLSKESCIPDSLISYTNKYLTSCHQNKKSILDYDTVALDEISNKMVIIDQTKLPGKIELLSLEKLEDVWEAIHVLRVRGAPAIGVAAAIGIYLYARTIQEVSFEKYYDKFKKGKDYLNSSRPTAVNLSWALERMEQVVIANKEKTTSLITEALHKEAIAIREEDIWVCKKIGEYGLSLVKPGDGLLTHCNAGQLATVKYGTATAPMYLGLEKGYDFKIFADETRPLLQGARLTSFELQSAGLDVTLICDNMSASVMKKGLVNAVFVGCDRVAANGDTANKIGTSMVALAANRYHVPFYICAPTSTIDRNTATGEDIVIEERNPNEITNLWYKEAMAPDNVKVFNPAFDVTDNDLITGIITEYGIAYPPYETSLKEIFMKKQIAQSVKKVMKEMK